MSRGRPRNPRSIRKALYGVVVRAKRIRPLTPRETALLLEDLPQVRNDIMEFVDQALQALTPLLALRSEIEN